MADIARHYRKKPVVITAYRTDVPVDIPTLEGTMRADPGDYIITGIKGERYPCKPDVFAATYEPVEDAAAASPPAAGRPAGKGLESIAGSKE